MRADSFRSRIEVIHKKWVAETLYLSFGKNWVDLWTNMFNSSLSLYFELKCRMIGYRPPGKEAWAVREQQVQEYKDAYGKENVFWMFLIYAMDRKVKEIKGHLAKKIISREVWIIPWDYINLYEAKMCKIGLIRYPKQIDFPECKTVWIGEVPFHYTDVRIKKLIETAKEMPF